MPLCLARGHPHGAPIFITAQHLADNCALRNSGASVPGNLDLLLLLWSKGARCSEQHVCLQPCMPTTTAPGADTTVLAAHAEAALERITRSERAGRYFRQPHNATTSSPSPGSFYAQSSNERSSTQAQKTSLQTVCITGPELRLRISMLAPRPSTPSHRRPRTGRLCLQHRTVGQCSLGVCAS